MMVEGLHKMVFPVRKAWLAVSARLKARKNGAGLLKLHNDIQTCGYEDVQIMWEMLRRPKSKVVIANRKPKRKRLWFLRSFKCSNHSARPSSSSTNQIR